MQDIKRGKPGEPIAISSKLGYIISGKIDKDIESSSVNMVSTHVLKVDTEIVDKNFELNETLTKFWRIERLGINTHELKDTVAQICNRKVSKLVPKKFKIVPKKFKNSAENFQI